jgi:hypothetical protein
MFALAIIIGFGLRIAIERVRGYRTERWFTSDLSTGYFWNDLTQTEKNIYVRGALETLIMGISNGANTPLPAGGTFNGFRDGLNQFYAEPANEPVPVNFAIDYIRLRANGINEEELEKKLIRARAVATEAAKGLR